MHNKPVPSNMMTAQTHEYIVCGPTGNLQDSVKFYCLTTGRIIKRHSFTPIPMSDRVIKWVNQTGLREKQGQTFWFLNRPKEPYKGTDTIPEDNPEFQGLLEEEATLPRCQRQSPRSDSGGRGRGRLPSCDQQA